MECLDVPNALNAVIGASLVVAGQLLMMQGMHIARGYGAYCFAFGFLLLGLAASGRELASFDLRQRRVLIAVGSAAAVVAGTFLMYYHVEDHVRKYLRGKVSGHPAARKDIVGAIPVIDNVLVYGGMAGLIIAIAMKEDGSFNYVKGALALGAAAVVCYSHRMVFDAILQGKSVRKMMLAHILSWGLLVLAIAYSC